MLRLSPRGAIAAACWLPQADLADHSFPSTTSPPWLFRLVVVEHYLWHAVRTVHQHTHAYVAAVERPQGTLIEYASRRCGHRFGGANAGAINVVAVGDVGNGAWTLCGLVAVAGAVDDARC